MLYEVITPDLVDHPRPLPDGGQPVARGDPALHARRVFPRRGRSIQEVDRRLQGRITSYNVCYTKLLRGADLERFRIAVFHHTDHLGESPAGIDNILHQLV